VHSAICRIDGSFKSTFKFEDAKVTTFLMHPLFSGCTNWPRLEKDKGEKLAASVPAASVTTAVDLRSEDGGAPLAERPNSSPLEEAAYAMGALADDPPSERALHGAAQGGSDPARNRMCFCAKI
jgi:hypothetical protein